VQGFRDTETLAWQEFEPEGRPYPIVGTGVLVGSRSSVPLHVSPADADLIPLLRSMARAARVLVLKSPFGESYVGLVRPGERSRSAAGHQQFEFSFTATETP
jgi:hypothetical protein